ncbi:MAG: ankyrin repeat domain-containing protein [Pyrinomonadaceae bacterium]
MMGSNWGPHVITVTNTRGRPFNAQFEQTRSERLSNNRTSQQIVKGAVFRDSGGRVRKEFLLQEAPSREVHIAFISDASKEVIYVLDVKSKTFVKDDLPAVPEKFNAEPLIAPVRSSLKVRDEDLGEQLLEGLICHGYRSHMEDSVIEFWYSDDLQEILLEKTVSQDEESILRLFEISRGEPSSTLFSVPADYTSAEEAQADSPYLSTPGLEEEGNAGIRLNLAAASGDITTVQSLLAKGADVNAKGYRDDTSLMAAAEGGHVAVVDTLLRAGAELNDRGGNGATALMLAAWSGQLKTVQSLLASGAKMDTNEDRQTALMLAAAEGHVAVVELLLSAGADVNAKESHAMTALMLAAANGQSAIVKLLLAAGAEMNAINSDGYTASKIARLEGQTETVKILEGVVE